MLIRTAHALAAALALAIPCALASDCADPASDLDTAVRKGLGVRAYSVEPMKLPMAAGAAFVLQLNLGGKAYTADLALDPVDTADCVMLLDDGSGPMKEVAPPPPCTYRGPVRGVPGSMASGSLIDGQFTGIVVLSDRVSAWNILPLNQIVKSAPRELHILSRFEDSEGGEWRCGVEASGLPTGLAPQHPSGGGPDSGPLFCELAIEADYPYFQAVGGTASTVAQDISTVIANVTSYSMLSGCNLRFRIVRYVIRATPQSNPGLYNVTDPNTLLQNFRTVWNNLAGAIPRDTAHMFTGQDLNGTTVGIAYLSCVCTSTFGYGLSQSRFSLQPGRRAALSAHELGHNFSANHCDASPNTCSPCWLMLATQGSTTNQLTRYGCSTDIIRNYAQGRPCLGPTDGAGAACDADLDGDGALTVLDMLAFQNAFTAGDPRADADHNGSLNVNDFLAYLGAFSAGCPG